MGVRDAWGALWESKATLSHRGHVVAELPATADAAMRRDQNDSILKSPSPTYLVRPPFGVPMNKNVPAIRALSRNPYVFSATQTIADEIASVEWEVFQKEGFNVSDEELAKAHAFFDNPNGNDESFSQLLRRTVPDILELDAGVWVKSFSFEKYVPRKGDEPDSLVGGELKQIFAKDGGAFLVNPDFFGYFGNRSDYIAPLYANPQITPELRKQMESAVRGTLKMPGEDPHQGRHPGRLHTAHHGLLPPFGSYAETFPQLYNMYDSLFLPQAAYFQYPTRQAQLPVPFGKREVIYMMRNPRTDRHYGTGAVEMLVDIIYTLIYGSKYNLDFYLNNNMPDGVLEYLGSNRKDIRRLKELLQKEFRIKDSFGNLRKIFFNQPMVSHPLKFVQFNLDPIKMEIIGQQQWFIKLLWACFGVNASEMGFTEDSNRATEHAQSAVVKRKVINPILKNFDYYINRGITPEFGNPGIGFRFKNFDLDEEHRMIDLFAKEITLGLRSRRDVADERGIDYDKQLDDMEEDGQSLSFPSGIVPGESEGADQEEVSHLDSVKSAPPQWPEGAYYHDSTLSGKAAEAKPQGVEDDLSVLTQSFRAWEDKLMQVLESPGGDDDEGEPAS